jgi:hypothetical protein
LVPANTTVATVTTASGTATVTRVEVPALTLERVLACDTAREGLRKHARFPRTHSDGVMSEVAFEMVRDDYNRTLSQLDSIRARRPKFVCINDDMQAAPQAVVAALRSFYTSYFPLPSQFELPAGQTNPVLAVEPLRELLRRRRALLVASVAGALVVAAALLAWLVRKRQRVDLAAGAGAARPHAQ